MVEMRELRAMVELLGRRAEAESRSRRLGAETEDLLTMVELETDSPKANPLHRCKAEEELRDSQDAAGQKMVDSP